MARNGWPRKAWTFSFVRYPVALLLFGVIHFGVITGEIRATSAKPTAHTSLTITAPDFVTNLGTRRVDVEREIAAHLAEKASEHFKFLRWLGPPTTGEEDSEPGGAGLEARLTAEEREFGQAIFLTYVARVGGAALATPELPRHELYDVFDDQPTHNPDRLKEDLREVLDADFGNDSFRQKLEQQFLRYVPLAAGLDTHPEAKAIILDLLWLDLQATTESELRVEFKAPRPAAKAATDPPPLNAIDARRRDTAALELESGATAAHDGTMILGPSGATEDPRWPGATQCTINELDFPPLRAPWDDQLPVILHRDNVEHMSVFMHDYVLDPRSGMSDGIDTELD